MNKRHRPLPDPVQPEPTPPHTNVTIAIPSKGYCPAPFTLCLANMIGYTMANSTGIDMAVGSLSSSLVSFGRERLIQVILGQTEATHVLFLDDDMVFPPETLLRLLTWNTPVIGANYRQRLCEGRFTAIARTGEPLQTTPDDDGLIEVNSLGLGVILIRREVFSAIPLPRFPLEWCPENNNYTGEDVMFCRAARAAGFHLFVDQRLSTTIGHLGEFEFSADTPPATPNSIARRNSGLFTHVTP